MSQGIIRALLGGLIGIFLISYGFLFLWKDFLFQRFVNSMQTDQTLERVTPLFYQIQKNRLPVYPIKTGYFQLRLEIERRRFLTAYDMALKLQSQVPGYYDLEWHIAFLSMKMLKPQRALFWIEMAIDYHPFEERNYLLKARILDSMDQEELAAEALDTAKKLSLRNRHFKEKNQKSKD